MARYLKDVNIRSKTYLGSARLVSCQITRRPQCLTTRPIRPSRRNGARLSSAQASGWRETGRWGQANEVGVNHSVASFHALPAVSEISPPDSGVVPFSEESPPPIKSGNQSSGHFGTRSKASSCFHRPQYSGGENDDRHDRAYGISCLTRPTAHMTPDMESQSQQDSHGCLGNECEETYASHSTHG